MKRIHLFLWLFIGAACASNRVDKIVINNKTSLESQIESGVCPQFLSIDFLGENSIQLDEVFSKLDCSCLEDLVIFDESIKIENHYVFNRLHSLHLESRDTIQFQDIILPDSLHTFAIRGKELFLGSTLNDKIIFQLRISVQKTTLPNFVDSLGAVEYLTIDGDVCDVSELSRFKLGFQNLNPMSDCLEKALSSQDSLPFNFFPE